MAKVLIMNIPELEGYKKPEKLKYNFVFLGMIGFILQIIFLIAFAFVRFWIENGYIPNQLSGSINISSSIGLLALLVFFVSLHELVHGAAFKYFGYEVRYGAILPAAYAIAEKQFIKSRDYLLVALAPLFVLDIFAIGFFFIGISVLSDIALFVLVINTAGAVGDLWMVYKIIRYPKDALYYDFSPRENYVYIPVKYRDLQLLSENDIDKMLN